MQFPQLQLYFRRWTRYKSVRALAQPVFTTETFGRQRWHKERTGKQKSRL
jgi:hypothetical protein